MQAPYAPEPARTRFHVHPPERRFLTSREKKGIISLRKLCPLILHEVGECSAIALDIKGYFDNINHSKLKEMWCKVIDESDLPIDQYKVFRSLTKYSYVNYSSFLKHFDINLKAIEKEQAGKHKSKKKIPKGYQSLFDLIPDSIVGSKFHDKMELLRQRKLVTINSIFDKGQKKRILKK